MGRLVRRHRLLVGLATLFGVTVARGALAQGTGEFLCSVGTRDGLSCEGDQNCPGGTCVIAQGVCDGGDDDGLTCDCAGGTCSDAPACTDDPSFGTCNGGSVAGACCDVATNCAGGHTCRGTARVCLGGDNKGFSCLSDTHCPSSQCVSTGKFCDAGDFADYSCVDDADCPSGACVQPPATATPTPPGSPRPTATPTRTRTPRPTTPTGTTTASPPTGTPSTPTSLTPTPRATSTIPAPDTGVVARSVGAGATTIELVDASNFPTSGVVRFGDDPRPFGFTRAPNSNILSLTSQIPMAVPAGTLVTGSVLSPTPGPHVRVNEFISQGGCAIHAAGGDSGVGVAMAVGIIALMLQRRGR